MVSMRQAALHDGQWMVLLVWFWNVLDCGFPVLSAFHESPELLSAEHYPQAGFPAALHEDDPAQTVSQHGISLPAAHTRVAPVPAVLALVRSVAASLLAGCAHRPCAVAAYFPSMARSLWGPAVVTVPA